MGRLEMGLRELMVMRVRRGLWVFGGPSHIMYPIHPPVITLVFSSPYICTLQDEQSKLTGQKIWRSEHNYSTHTKTHNTRVHAQSHITRASVHMRARYVACYARYVRFARYAYYAYAYYVMLVLCMCAYYEGG